jgi:F-type H+-transporting ATPase subunit gamma
LRTKNEAKLIMANLKEVRGRITSVKSTQQITKAMKMVAAAKLRRAQNAITQMRPYAQKLEGVLQNVTASLGEGDFSTPFAQVRQPKNILIVYVTSDKGLCGAFNTNINKAVINLLQTKYARQYQDGTVTLMPVGKKGYEFFKRRNYKIEEKYALLLSLKGLSFENVKEAAEFVMNAFKEGTYDAVEIVYNEFKNVATQIVQTSQFLPVLPATTGKASSADYVFEPNKTEIVQDLIPKSLKIKFYKSVLDSIASEHGARMTAMDKATENAGELLKSLQLEYNRTRQANITKEILEIVGGAEALAQA